MMHIPTSEITLMSDTPKPDWNDIAKKVCERIPALWPLDSFVAVNPFFGFADKPFNDVCELMEHVTHQSMLMPCEYFQKQYQEGRITERDLKAAIQQANADVSSQELIAWLNEKKSAQVESNTVLTLADIAKSSTPETWNQLINQEISKWCAAYYDQSQSAWRMPWQDLPLYSAWRQAATIDATPELLGLKGFSELVTSIPGEIYEAIPMMLTTLQVNEAGVENYLLRLLMTSPGWSSYVQYRVKEKQMEGIQDNSLLDLLAIRLVYEVALRKIVGQLPLWEFWTQKEFHEDQPSESTQNLLLWHSALEISFQRDLQSKLLKSALQAKPHKHVRPALQAVFCIDVRSEIMRRSLEATSPEIETLGFAGFFGMPIEYVPFGQSHSRPQLPVLFSPKYRIQESMPSATLEQERQALAKLQLGERLNHSWNTFKNSAVSCFSFVETTGVGFAWNLIKDGFQLTSKTANHDCCSHTIPDLKSCRENSHMRPSGIPADDQLNLALGALKNMGLTANFARLIMICGHGSNTTNNPYAAALDCGACGGHAGDSNARVAVSILNNPSVRAGLTAHGIHIPDDTIFVAALHDTTTDHISLFDLSFVPKSHQTDLSQLQLWLEEASEKNRLERAPTLHLNGGNTSLISKQIHQRSKDWSTTRPEWGLAGNAAFIAAPRERTQNLDLKGRAFLHNYNHATDTGKTILELIMTAPLIVANWINMQYYASMVNNDLWGSGNKTIHNVVGAFGIQQGNDTDLQMGLPMQSLHDGQKWMHEPLRLNVFIEAPSSDISAVIARHEIVRHLCDHSWIHLFAIEDQGKSIHRYLPGGSWKTTCTACTGLSKESEMETTSAAG